MTSTTSCKNSLSQAWSIFKWTLKSSKAVWIIYLSLLAFSGICFAVLNIGVNSLINMMSYSLVEATEATTAFTQMTALYFQAEVTALAVIFAFVLAVMGFGYLHNKRMTDMFGAMPISRRTLFFSKWASSIIIPTVPMLLINIPVNLFMPKSAVLEEGFNALSGMGIYLGNSFEAIFRGVIAIVAFVSFFGLLSICCGKKSDAIVSTIVIMGAFPVAMALLQILPMSLINGYVADINIDLIFALTPTSATETGPIWYWLLFIGVCLVLSFFLVKIRKSESAQSRFAFRLPFELVKIIVSFGVGITIGYLFLLVLGWNTDRTGCYVAFWCGMILGSIVTHTILQIVLNHGFKGYLKGLISYGVMIGTFAVVFLVLATGFAGYENYVPKAEEVKAVTFTDGASYMVDGKNIVKNNYSEDKKVIEKTINAHKSICEEYSKSPATMFEMSGTNISGALENFFSPNAFSTYYDEYDYDNSNGIYRIRLTYIMNNGTKVNRIYTAGMFGRDGFDTTTTNDDTIFNESVYEFVRSNDFVKLTQPIFILDENYCKVAEITVYDDDTDNDRYVKVKDKEQKLELIEAVRKDILADKNYVNGVYEDYGWIDFYYGNKKYRYDNLNILADVGGGYENTLKFLQKAEKAKSN